MSKKSLSAIITKTVTVTVLKRGQVRESDGEVYMPTSTIDLSIIKRLGQSKKVSFTASTTASEMQRKLEESFNFLSGTRFSCAKTKENRSKLDFLGERHIWSGKEIVNHIKWNSALYVFCEEENPANQLPLDEQLERFQISRDELAFPPLATGIHPSFLARHTTDLSQLDHPPAGAATEAALFFEPNLPRNNVQNVSGPVQQDRRANASEENKANVTRRNPAVEHDEGGGCSRGVLSNDDNVHWPISESCGGQLYLRACHPLGDHNLRCHLTEEQNGDQPTSLIGQEENMQISRNELGFPPLASGIHPSFLARHTTDLSQLDHSPAGAATEAALFFEPNLPQNNGHNFSGPMLQYVRGNEGEVNEANVTRQNPPVELDEGGGCSRGIPLESSSEDCSDPGYATGNTQDSSRNQGGPLLSMSLISPPQLLDKYKPNCNVQLYYSMKPEMKEVPSLEHMFFGNYLSHSSLTVTPVSVAVPVAESEVNNQTSSQEWNEELLQSPFRDNGDTIIIIPSPQVPQQQARQRRTRPAVTSTTTRPTSCSTSVSVAVPVAESEVNNQTSSQEWNTETDTHDDILGNIIERAALHITEEGQQREQYAKWRQERKDQEEELENEIRKARELRISEEPQSGRQIKVVDLEGKQWMRKFKETACFQENKKREEKESSDKVSFRGNKPELVEDLSKTVEDFTSNELDGDHPKKRKRKDNRNRKERRQKRKKEHE